MLQKGVERRRGLRTLTGQGGLSLDKLIAGAPEFLVTPLLIRPVCLISQGRFESNQIIK